MKLFDALAYTMVTVVCCSAASFNSTNRQPSSYNELTEKLITGNKSASFVKKIGETAAHSSNRTKHGRFLNFNTGTGNLLKVELAFTVPFITIPMSGFLGSMITGGASTGSSTGVSSAANINVGALVVAAALAMTALFLVPKIFQSVAGMPGMPSFGTWGRTGGEGPFKELISRVDDALSTYNIDTSVCTQRAVCSYIREASTRVNAGSATSFDKILDGFTSNYLAGFMLDGTAIKEAIDIGRRGSDCSAVYTKCPLTKEMLYIAAKNFMSGIN